MKKKYIEPVAFVVNVKTHSDIMDGVFRVGSKNQTIKKEDVAGKEYGFDDDDDETGQNSFRNLWDD